MALIGTAIGIGLGAFGSKPKIPELPSINPTSIQQQTIAGNLQSLPQLQEMGAKVNEHNQAQQLGMLKRAADFMIPGGFGKAQGIINSQLSGEIPLDVQEAIERTSAARAFSGGFGGSGLGRNLTLRDFGLTSLGIQQQGLSNFQNFMGMGMPQAFDMTSMFFTPGQRLAAAFQDRSDHFNRNLMHAQVKAAPEPWKAALTQAIIQDEAQLMSSIGSIAAMCWIARAAYGEDDLRWRIFRVWMLTEAPRAFRNLYIAVGPYVGAIVKRSDRLRAILRPLMDNVVNHMLNTRYAN